MTWTMSMMLARVIGHVGATRLLTMKACAQQRKPCYGGLAVTHTQLHPAVRLWLAAALRRCEQVLGAAWHRVHCCQTVTHASFMQDVSFMISSHGVQGYGSDPAVAPRPGCRTTSTQRRR